MKSIQTKMILLILSGMLALGLCLGLQSVHNATKLTDFSNRQNLNLICSQQAARLDAAFIQMEDILHYVANSTLRSTNKVRDIESKVFRNVLSERLHDDFENAVGAMPEVYTYYVHFSEELVGGSDGIWYIRGHNGTGPFEKQQLTVVADFDKNDITRVGWYYIPLKTGKPVWLDPYYNANIDKWLISYTVPIYKDGVPIAVAGIDIDFDLVQSKCRSISAFKTGHALLLSREGRLIYSPNYQNILQQKITPPWDFSQMQGDNSASDLISYQFRDKDYSLAYVTLRNGMKLSLTAPDSEIYSERDYSILQMILVSLILWGVFTFITTLVARRMIAPLHQLTLAAEEIADGRLDVKLSSYKSNDEIAILSQSFKKTVSRLKMYIAKISAMAYIDSLTGLKNVSSYSLQTQDIDQKIKAGTAAFAVVMADVNRLKLVNDLFGHIRGDEAICTTAKAVCDIYAHSPVFRIGGDEFAIVLTGQDYENRDQLYEQLTTYLVPRNPDDPESWKIISIASGMAVFDKDIDTCYMDVFKRADLAMYERKKQVH